MTMKCSTSLSISLFQLCCGEASSFWTRCNPTGRSQKLLLRNQRVAQPTHFNTKKKTNLQDKIDKEKGFHPFQVCSVLCTPSRPSATDRARLQPRSLHELGECLLEGEDSMAQRIRYCSQDQAVVYFFLSLFIAAWASSNKQDVGIYNSKTVCWHINFFAFRYLRSILVQSKRSMPNCFYSHFCHFK